MENIIRIGMDTSKRMFQLHGVNGAEQPVLRRKLTRSAMLAFLTRDVMLEGDDVYGDGVNIAARLQELAEPGGILISGPVYDQVHNKLSIGFESLGQQSLKNVAQPVTGYRILQGGAPSRPQPPPEPMRKPPAAPGSAESGFARAWGWYTRLPRVNVVLIAISFFLFVINVFSGLHEIWFQWPAAVLLLIAFLRAAKGRGPSWGGGAPRRGRFRRVESLQRDAFAVLTASRCQKAEILLATRACHSNI